MNKNININQVSFKKYVFISGERPERNYSDYLLKSLNHFGFNYQEVEGYYKGIREDSYKVKIDLESDLNLLTKLAFLCHQEAVLVIDARTCQAELLLIDDDRFPNNVKSRTNIGTWRNVRNVPEGQHHDNCSIINEEVYVVVE